MALVSKIINSNNINDETNYDPFLKPVIIVYASGTPLYTYTAYMLKGGTRFTINDKGRLTFKRIYRDIKKYLKEQNLRKTDCEIKMIMK